MENTRNFRIYNSSAGSGKTYTLTKEYLKLALQTNGEVFNPSYFKHILAITFTNDAANEMKERIISKLKAFSEGKNDPMLTELCKILELDEKTIRGRSRKVFEKIMYQYSDFSVSTIDSFTNKLVSAFTQELDVPFNYQLDLDTNLMVESAIDALVDKVSADEQNRDLTDFMVEYAMEFADAGKNWRHINNELQDFSKNLLKEQSEPILKRMKGLALKDFVKIKKSIQTIAPKIEKQVQEIAQKRFERIKEKKIPSEGFFKGYVYKYFENNATGSNTSTTKDFLKPLEGEFLKNFEQDVWYSKSSKFAAAIDEIKEELKEGILQIEHIKKENGDAYSLAKAILKEFYKISLVNEITQEVETVKTNNKMVHISETNQKIAKIVQNEPVPYIYERVGEKYHHILIDEFQDTSSLQWHNLLPLVQNSLSEGYFNLLVGDAKQAVYRWRGGEMEQFVNLSDTKASAEEYVQKILESVSEMQQSEFLEDRCYNIHRDLEVMNLDSNFRSSTEIVAFNNDFFDLIKGKYRYAEKVYTESAIQKTHSKSPTGGGVRISFIQTEQGENREEAFLEEILNNITDALNRGFEYRDIAILCRAKSKGSQIATFLKERSIPIVSAESLMLASDAKVNFLMAMMKAFSNPEDSLAKSEALYLFHTVVRRQIPNVEQNEEIREAVYSENSTIDGFYGVFEKYEYFVDYQTIRSLSLYEMMEELLRTFQILEQHSQRSEFVFRLLDWILDFSIQKSNHLNDFLDEWREKKRSISVTSAGNVNAITIMTVHKSKGLEFPVVILPNADWQMEPRFDTPFWADIRQNNLPISQKYNESLTHILMNYNTSVSNPTIEKQKKSEQEKTILENLNILYVAFTRPVYLLYIIAKYPSKSSSSTPVNGLLKAYLEQQQGENQWQGDKLHYQLGTFAPIIERKQEHQHQPMPLKNLQTFSLQRKLGKK